MAPLLLLALLLQSAGLSHERFFVGRSESVGTVHVILSGRHGARTHNRGRMEGGALILDQIVEEQGKPPRRRTWRIARSADNRVTGTITDAQGPVTGSVNGNVLHLTYRSVEGPSVEQWITLAADGRSAHNRMRFRRFGLNVATYEEVIRRVD